MWEWVKSSMALVIAAVNATSVSRLSFSLHVQLLVCHGSLPRVMCTGVWSDHSFGPFVLVGL